MKPMPLKYWKTIPIRPDEKGPLEVLERLTHNPEGFADGLHHLRQALGYRTHAAIELPCNRRGGDVNDDVAILQYLNTLSQEHEWRQAAIFIRVNHAVAQFGHRLQGFQTLSTPPIVLRMSHRYSCFWRVYSE
jgi:hypothetical protein